MSALLGWKTARNRVKGPRRTHPRLCLEVLEGRALLSGALNGNPTAVGTSPPQSSAFGNTLPGWMQTWMNGYFSGSFTEQGQQVRNVRLLPLPIGTPPAENPGTGTFADPLILQGHTDVSLKPGTAMVLPVVVWVGERYDGPGGAGYTADPKLPQEYLTDPTTRPISVTLDGQTLISSNQGNVSQYYFDVPLDISYASPTTYGSTGAIFAQGVGLVIPPLAVGKHTITLDAVSRIPPNDPNGTAYLNPQVYDAAAGVGWHYENSWTIDVTPRG